MGKLVGVIGAGKFGITVCKLLSNNTDVLLYARNTKTYELMTKERSYKGIALPENMEITNDRSDIPARCNVIFPVVNAANFRLMMQEIGPMLRPDHILIHGTKGLDVMNLKVEELSPENISIQEVLTLSEVVKQESTVVRVGCLSGPNLANEILAGLPTATVVASEFDEVMDIGQQLLSNNKFYVFGSHDIKGAELAGAYKNVIAIASGILAGRELGKNIQAMLITRGLREMSLFGQLMGSSKEAFLGTAGVGDLVATATSTASRNFYVGYQIGKGDKLEDILAGMDEVAEGLRTLKIAYCLSRKYRVPAQITAMLHAVVYEGYDIENAITMLMRYPSAQDVDFM